MPLLQGGMAAQSCHFTASGSSQDVMCQHIVQVSDMYGLCHACFRGGSLFLLHFVGAVSGRTPVSACWQLPDVPWPTWGRYKVVGSLALALCTPFGILALSVNAARQPFFELSSNAIWTTIWSAAMLNGTASVGGLLPICGPRKRALILGLLCLSWGSGPPRGHSICMGIGAPGCLESGAKPLLQGGLAAFVLSSLHLAVLRDRDVPTSCHSAVICICM